MSFLGPSKNIRFHEGKGPSKNMRFLGPSKDMRFSGPSKDMRFHEGKHKNGSIKAHEVFGPSNEILYQICLCT